MNNPRFPLYALILGLVFMLVVFLGAKAGVDEHPRIPLLALLAMCEFAFLSSIAGAYSGFKQLRRKPGLGTWAIMCGCAILAVGFLFKGVALWPQ